jgi:plasmid stability protein
MSTLVIKNMPDQLHEKLRRQAERNHRSLNKETVAVLEKALGATTRRPPKLSPPLKLRGGFRPSIEDIEAAIAEGRD